ncbi:hypothetical protein AbraIFM66950_002774 [Aspergillus brasiliensis]|nr:hypothetical protein AbraIFM66950_002774 [Aspergillus brasiliensis]
MYFHAYNPLPPQSETALHDVAAQHVEHGKSTPVIHREDRSFFNHQATASSSLGYPGSPGIESAMPSSGEATFPEPQSNFNATGSIDGDDLPHRETSLFWGCDCDHEPSTGPRRASVGSCHETRPAASEVHGTDLWSCESRPCNTTDGDKDGELLPTRHSADGSKSGLLDILGPKTLPVSSQLVEESQALSGGEGSQPVTETIMGSTSKILRPKRHNRKKAASPVLERAEVATARPPRTRARARAEASSHLSHNRAVRLYSAAEDDLLRNLVLRGLPWEQIEHEFGPEFAKRGKKSLQGRWSKNLKFLARPAGYSNRRGE